jgi:hypothetical protein
LSCTGCLRGKRPCHDMIHDSPVSLTTVRALDALFEKPKNQTFEDKDESVTSAQEYYRWKIGSEEEEENLGDEEIKFLVNET